MTVFDRIYRQNRWAGSESRSGPGSGRAATDPVARALVELVAEIGITTVLDVGCGDGFWMPDLPGYVGIDVSREAIRLARLNHPERYYTVADLPGGEVGAFDLVIVRDVLQHLPMVKGIFTIGQVIATGSKWLLASTFVGGENVDIEAGDAYSPDLMARPFWMGQPERLIFDGWDYDSGTLGRDPRKHLGLWRLAS